MALVVMWSSSMSVSRQVSAVRTPSVLSMSVLLREQVREASM
jgi:hypothetical protein